MHKWLIYQKERFPLLQYIPMMAAFSFCAVSYSAHLGQNQSNIRISQYLVAFFTTLFFFMLLRIADEYKDFEEDSKYRPYRPVQRGLVKLSSLRNIGIVLIILQIIMAVLIDLRLLGILAIVYIWFFLMSAEFFVPKWLKRQHTLYLLSHMVIMPLIDMYATAVEWVPRNSVISFGIFVFMVSSFCDGTVVEVGRKLRARENEEYGVDTYTQIWGPVRAVVVWMICMTISFASTVIAGFQVGVGIPIFCVLFVFYVFAAYISVRFGKNPTPKNAKVFEVFPGVWMMVMYLLLGIIPFFS